MTKLCHRKEEMKDQEVLGEESLTRTEQQNDIHPHTLILPTYEGAN